jgi:hypothetical protein
LRSLLSLLANECSIDEGIVELGKEVAHKQTILLDNHFEVLAGVESIDGKSLLRKRVGTVSFLERTEASVMLHFAHKTVSLPLKALTAIEFILASGVFTAGEIPGLTAASRLVLARRLVKDGYLTVSSLAS